MSLKFAEEHIVYHGKSFLSSLCNVHKDTQTKPRVIPIFSHDLKDIAVGEH